MALTCFGEVKNAPPRHYNIVRESVVHPVF